MKVAIAGENGFIGLHLTNYFRNILKYEVVSLGRNYLLNLEKIKDVDWFIIAAFVHRNPEKGKVIELNRELTSNTILALKAINFSGNIYFLSSIQEGNSSEYGIAKSEANEKYKSYCKKNKNKFLSIKLPNIFGEYAKPFRTSFIATFCYSLLNDISIQKNRNVVSLCYVKDVISLIAKFKDVSIEKYITNISVEEVYNKLNQFNQLQKENKIPKILTKFDLDLYLTFTQYNNYNL